jgi:hypothetical protein
MPEDDLFKNGTENTETQTQQIQQTQQVPKGLTAEEVAQIVKTVVTEELAPTRQSISQIEGVFTNLQQQQAQAPQVDPTEFAQRLYSGDARNAVSEAIAEDARPLVVQAATTQAKITVDRAREAIESEWGPGAWDLVHKGEIEPRVAEALRETPEALMSESPIMNAVATVTGTSENLKQLMEHRDNWKKSVAENEKEELNRLTKSVMAQSNMTGGIRRAPGDEPKLGPEYDEYLDGFFRDTGTKLDKERVEKSMASGNTIEDYLEAHKEKE